MHRRLPYLLPTTYYLRSPLIHQPTGFPSLLQASWWEDAKFEPAHTAEAVRPNVRVASFEVLPDGGFNRRVVNAVRQLEPEFQDVVDAFLPDRYLPIFGNPLHIVEHALENLGYMFPAPITTISSRRPWILAMRRRVAPQGQDSSRNFVTSRTR